VMAHPGGLVKIRPVLLAASSALLLAASWL
jgi:hypothetical protein